MAQTNSKPKYKLVKCRQCFKENTENLYHPVGTQIGDYVCPQCWTKLVESDVIANG